jgi:hypothetical protein
MSEPRRPSARPGRPAGRRGDDLARAIARLEGTEKQRWFEELMASFEAGTASAEDLTAGDLELLREVFGERADDLDDLFDQLRGGSGDELR